MTPKEDDDAIGESVRKFAEFHPASNFVLKDLENSIVVIDDPEAFEKKVDRDRINLMVEKILKGGRKLNIHMIFINHKFRDYKKTSSVILECNFIFFFTQTGIDTQIEDFIKAYVRFPKDVIERILNTNYGPYHNWVMIHKRAPIYIMNEHEIYFPKPPTTPQYQNVTAPVTPINDYLQPQYQSQQPMDYRNGQYQMMPKPEEFRYVSQIKRDEYPYTKQDNPQDTRMSGTPKKQVTFSQKRPLEGTQPSNKKNKF